MKTFKVTITGNQAHIVGNEWENQSSSNVENILNTYWDDQYPKPQKDGENWELNVDKNIRIEEE